MLALARARAPPRTLVHIAESCSWVRKTQFLPFVPGTIEQADELIEWYESDLTELLTMKYHVFWSHVVFDPSLLRLVDSFLRFFPRPIASVHEIAYRQPSLPPGWERVFQAMFRVILRMSFYKEDAEHFMDRFYYAKLIYDKVRSAMRADNRTHDSRNDPLNTTGRVALYSGSLMCRSSLTSVRCMATLTRRPSRSWSSAFSRRSPST